MRVRDLVEALSCLAWTLVGHVKELHSWNGCLKIITQTIFNFHFGKCPNRESLGLPRELSASGEKIDLNVVAELVQPRMLYIGDFSFSFFVFSYLVRVPILNQ